MPDGGCFCGKCRITYSGEPKMKCLCHCLDCRKISGSTYSTNVVVPEDGFEVTSGTPKTISKTADGGETITSFFCGDCGSTMYRESGSFPGLKIVKAGVMDDVEALAEAKPDAELYTKTRVNWVQPVPGADQKDAMS
ncbi:hypothetical protein H2199_005726 [Coniosporium tulheliwenetii]|uniref:Uncharacterized protein n=1 Tax=Coniosporium tulheliwenetii TaxID=3383036 RepID=A0ACC2Z089_9PEZI|nr:hypothetical protein H2199_005726 [Cladosporium sp. JES 115]